MSEAFEQAKSLFVAGIRAFESGRFSEAEKNFESSLALLPDRTSTQNNLASTQIQLGKADAALRVLDRVLEREPENLEALSHRGAALIALDRHDEAIRAFDRVLAADPNRTAVRLHRATSLGIVGRDRDAIGEFDRIVATEPNHAEAWLRRGQSLLRLVEHERALASCRKAVEIDPSFAEAWTICGTILAELKRNDEAAHAFEQAIASGGDVQLNRFFLAGMTTTPDQPAAPPRRYVETLFDDYADTFDQHLLNVLHYQAHNILIERLMKLMPRLFERALDLGCGTGLTGRLLQPIAGAIVGVDLSANMLEKAAKRGIYEELVHADLVEHLQATDRRYDLVVAGDVFIYIGDLGPIFAGAARVLEPDGAFCFSTEEAEGDDDFVLRTTLRYAHAESFIRRLAAENGFAVVEIEHRPLREDRNVPIPGLFVYLRYADTSLSRVISDGAPNRIGGPQ